MTLGRVHAPQPDAQAGIAASMIRGDVQIIKASCARTEPAPAMTSNAASAARRAGI